MWKYAAIKENGRGVVPRALWVSGEPSSCLPFEFPGAFVRSNCYLWKDSCLWRSLISVYLYCGLNFKPSLLVLNRNLQIDHCFANIRQTKYLEPNLPECCFRFLSLRPLSFLECQSLVTSGLPYWFRGFQGIHATVLPWGLWRHGSRDLKEAGVFTENSSELGGSGL